MKLVGGNVEDEESEDMTQEEWQWAYTNGSEISDDSGIDRDRAALDAISTYENAVSKYQSLKREYQTTLQWQLLLLEINSDNVNIDAQVNADNENNIVVWQQVR